MVASPDGTAVYVAIQNAIGKAEMVRRINVESHAIDQNLTVNERILDMKVSPDSKSLYPCAKRKRAGIGSRR
jgi:hypothetical protein